jgi:O-acetyl-ADP-ribose deacetylase (regulator of RNase III)
MMLINYVAGDLFGETNQNRVYAIDCNTEGVMNTQTGVIFRSRYPQMYSEYVRRCSANPSELALGQVFMWKGLDGTVVFNLAIQTSRFYTLAPINVIENAYREMRKLADAEEITSINMPPIGGGMGNLNWDRSRKALERAFGKWQGKLFIYMKGAGKW